MNEGEKIKRYLNDLPGGLTAFAKKTKKVRAYFYYNFAKEPLPQAFLDFLIHNKVDIRKALEQRETPAGMIEIPIQLNKDRQAFVVLPEEHTDSDIEKVARVLRAYKK